MKVNVNGHEIEMACFNCFHWVGNREDPASVGTCIALPPTAFMVWKAKSDIVSAKVEEVPEIQSAWAPVQGLRRCGGFTPVQLQVPASAPAGVTKQ